MCDYQVDFGVVIRNLSGMFFLVAVGAAEDLNTPFPTLPVIHLSVFSGPERNNSND